MNEINERIGMDSEVRIYSWEEFRTKGLLWLINCVAAHPRGYAITWAYPPDATKEAIEAGLVDPIGWYVQGDGSERWSFACDPETTRIIDGLFDSVKELMP